MDITERKSMLHNGREQRKAVRKKNPFFYRTMSHVCNERDHGSFVSDGVLILNHVSHGSLSKSIALQLYFISVITCFFSLTYLRNLGTIEERERVCLKLHSKLEAKV